LAYSTDAGKSFTQPSEVRGMSPPAPASNSSQQGMLTDKLAAASGALALVNGAFEPGRESHVWLLRGRLLD
jgi:hypothetical protein